jgi:hypothetical protein
MMYVDSCAVKTASLQTARDFFQNIRKSISISFVKTYCYSDVCCLSFVERFLCPFKNFVTHLPPAIFTPLQPLGTGRDSSVSIAPGYGMDGPGIESQWGRDFSHLSRSAPRPTQPPVEWVLGLSRGPTSRGMMLTTHTLLVPRS